METIAKYFFRDMGLMLGRSLRRILNNMNTPFAIIPITLMLLLIYIVGGAILALKELLHLAGMQKSLTDM